MIKKASILITGATGFLGSAICKHLVELGFAVTIAKRSTSSIKRLSDVMEKIKFIDLDTVCLQEVFKSNKFEVIIHCATNYGKHNEGRPEIVNANLILPLKLLDLASANGGVIFINTDTFLDKMVSYYSLSKNQFKDWLKFYANEIHTINIVLEHFYGEGDDSSKFVSFIVDSLLKNVPAIDLTKGEQRRDFIYVDDVVAAFEVILNKALLNTDCGFEEYQVGSGCTTSIRDFVLMAKEFCSNNSTQLNFGALPYRPQEIMNAVVDIEKLLCLGWTPKVSLDEGLSRMVAEERKALL